MNQGIDISIAKLSAPVEALNLSRRTCRALLRARISTVAEILLAGTLRLRGAKNVADITLSRIFTALANYLELPEEQLVGITRSGSRSTFEDEGDLWEAPVHTLPLSATAFQALEYMGCSQIKELMRARAHEYNGFLGVCAMELFEIDQVLRHHLAEVAYARLRSIAGEEASPGSAQTPDMDPPWQTYALPRLNERIWSVVTEFAMQRRTLGEMGCSKTVRGAIRQAHKYLHKNLRILSGWFDHCEQRSSLLLSNLRDPVLELKTLVQDLIPDPSVSTLIVPEEDVERTIVLLRSLALFPSRWFAEEMEGRWPTLFLVSSLVEPALVSYRPVRRFLQEREREKRNKPYHKLVYAILRQAGQPMHWREIAEEARHLGGRSSFVTRSIHSSLFTHKHKETFVHVGGGRYALAEWGIPAVQSYPAIIASLLRQENRPLPLEVIFDRVSAIRPVSRGSLTMNLTLHPRFYQSLPGTFGLRGWLPETSTRQELSTPEWLIERDSSVRRVEWAATRGLDVKKYLSEDGSETRIQAD